MNASLTHSSIYRGLLNLFHKPVAPSLAAVHSKWIPCSAMSCLDPFSLKSLRSFLSSWQLIAAMALEKGVSSEALTAAIKMTSYNYI